MQFVKDQQKLTYMCNDLYVFTSEKNERSRKQYKSTCRQIEKMEIGQEKILNTIKIEIEDQQGD